MERNYQNRDKRGNFSKGRDSRRGESKSYGPSRQGGTSYGRHSEKPQQRTDGKFSPKNTSKFTDKGSVYGSKFAKPAPKKPAKRELGVERKAKSPKFLNLSEPMRLNKFLANSNICSRREADEFIQAGVVSVNGQIVTELGLKIVPDRDKVHFHQQLVTIDKRIYILLNKPKNVITTAEDPQDRQTVLDIIKEGCPERVYPVGRLDRNTTGVLLLTNDGDLTEKLTHPKYEKKKIYQVRLDKDLLQEHFDALLEGIVLEDGEIHADSLEFVKDDSRKDIGIEIHSGRNRIVRRMFESFGYRIVALDRVYFAGLTKKNLPRGKWRFLSETEINFLKMN